jgi:hypothetical protein
MAPLGLVFGPSSLLLESNFRQRPLGSATTACGRSASRARTTPPSLLLFDRFCPAQMHCMPDFSFTLHYFLYEGTFIRIFSVWCVIISFTTLGCILVPCSLVFLCHPLSHFRASVFAAVIDDAARHKKQTLVAELQAFAASEHVPLPRPAAPSHHPIVAAHPGASSHHPSHPSHHPSHPPHPSHPSPSPHANVHPVPPSQPSSQPPQPM